MERQTDSQRGTLGAGKQQSVATEVVDADTLGTNAAEEMAEAARRQELPGEQVMPLHARLVSRFTTTINATE
jgi:hypothetical protein